MDGSTLATVVIDPGHGGNTPVGGSSANHASGPNGLLEKDVTLDLAGRLKRILEEHCHVLLTRADDTNLSLEARANAARGSGAAAFVSIHLNGSPEATLDGIEVYTARDATDASQRLARALADAVGSVTGLPARLYQQDLGVLLPARHARDTAACLVEVAFLTNPHQAQRLADADYRQRLADAMAQAIRAHVTAPLTTSHALSGAPASVIDHQVEEVLTHIRAEARLAAGVRRTVDPSSSLATVLASRYLATYLAAPNSANATTAIAAIARQNTRATAPTVVCGKDDRWEAGTPGFNGGPIPGALRAVLPWLPAEFRSATEILTVANRRALSHIDVPFLLGHYGIDPLNCLTPPVVTGDLDLDPDGSINESQLMHWATGVKYASLGRDPLRELFIAYELWHLEHWDVFGHDPINDLIAEDAGRALSEQIVGLRLNRANYTTVLDECFVNARAWVGALLRLRAAELDRQIRADPPPSAWIHWHGEIKASSVDHPYHAPSVRKKLTNGESMAAVKRSELVHRYIEVYTLVFEADAWEAAHGAIPLTARQREIASGQHNTMFRMLSALDEGSPSALVPHGSTLSANGFGASVGSTASAPMLAAEARPSEIPLDPGVGGRSIGTDALLVGDIIVLTTSQLSSAVIRAGTGQLVSHAMLYVGNGQVVEALGDGVGLHTLRDAIADATLAVAFRYPDLNEAHALQVRDFALHQIGRRFNFVGIVRQALFQLDRLVWCHGKSGDAYDRCMTWVGQVNLGTPSNDTFFCSQLVLAAFESAALPLTQTPPQWTSPGDIADLRLQLKLGYVGHLKTPTATARSLGHAESDSRITIVQTLSGGAPLPNLSEWESLISFRPPTSVQTSLQNRVGRIDWPAHHLEDAYGQINLDFYPVVVSRLPSVGGHTLSAEDLLTHVRLDINSVIDRGVCEFAPYDAAEAAKWKSKSPLGTIVHIDMKAWGGVNPDDGSVVLAEIAPDHWTFSTVWTTGDLGHPVSGNRKFGFTRRDDGGYVFSTRGADRTTALADHALARIVFSQAHALFTSLQNGIAHFVNSHGGTAAIDTAISARFPWEDVKSVYHHPTVSWI